MNIMYINRAVPPIHGPCSNSVHVPHVKLLEAVSGVVSVQAAWWPEATPHSSPGLGRDWHLAHCHTTGNSRAGRLQAPHQKAVTCVEKVEGLQENFLLTENTFLTGILDFLKIPVSYMFFNNMNLFREDAVRSD